ncbi:hypothetical protein [Empedobacter brevis]|uniref:hypothetical protein n=1 Tax=Empedobacter brevis TaxID=247 RepID=UPI0039AFA58B
MKNYFYSFFTLFLLLNCSEKKLEVEKLSIEDLKKTEEYANASPEKLKLFSELNAFQRDLQNKQIQKIPDYLDCPKRIEELDLNTKNTMIRTDIEANSFRLSTNLVTDNFDLIYNELDLNIINEAIKSISETDLLANDNASTNVKVGECDYHTSISMKNNEVKFDIKSVEQNPECKKDQKWKFVSNGEILVLDHRKIL